MFDCKNPFQHECRCSDEEVLQSNLFELSYHTLHQQVQLSLGTHTGLWKLHLSFHWEASASFHGKKLFIFIWNNHLEPNCSTTSGLTKNQSIIVRALSKCFLKIDRLGVTNTAPGRLLQCQTFSVKKCFPMSRLSFHRHSSNHSSVSYHWIPESRAQHLPLTQPFLRNLWRATKLSLPIVSPNLTSPKISAAPHRICLPSLSLALLSSFRCIGAP